MIQIFKDNPVWPYYCHTSSCACTGASHRTHRGAYLVYFQLESSLVMGGLVLTPRLGQHSKVLLDSTVFSIHWWISLGQQPSENWLESSNYGIVANYEFFGLMLGCDQVKPGFRNTSNVGLFPVAMRVKRLTAKK